jgi:hypothetical protein
MMNMYLLFLGMPSIKSDLYAVQISSNIFKLTNTAPITFQILSISGLFNQVALLRFFEQYQALGVDIAPFVFGMLVRAAMMLDGVEPVADLGRQGRPIAPPSRKIFGFSQQE